MDLQKEHKVDEESPPSPNGSSMQDRRDDMTPVVDEKRQKALLWKLDCHIIPLVVVLYLLSFLDRGRFSLHISCASIVIPVDTLQ